MLIAGYQIWNSRNSNRQAGKQNPRLGRNAGRYNTTKRGLDSLARETKELEQQIKSMGGQFDLSALGLDKSSQFENIYKDIMKNKKNN